MSDIPKTDNSLRNVSTIGLTALATLMCMAGSAGYALFVFVGSSEVPVTKAVVAALILPVFVGAPVYYYLLKRIRALAFRNLRLEAQSRRDGLTHCLNQMAFHRQVEAFIGAKQKFRRRAALLIIDADHFKQINDTFGHDTGNEAIKLIADKLRMVVRRCDPIGRIGGEEFAVLLRDADCEAASAVAERIRTSINLADIPGAALGAHLSVSVGGSVFEDDVTFAEVFKAADERLYKAKAEGRNRIEIGLFAHTRKAA